MGHFGMIPVCLFHPMVKWDGMDTGDTNGTLWYNPRPSKTAQFGIPNVPLDVCWQSWTCVNGHRILLTTEEGGIFMRLNHIHTNCVSKGW